MQVISEKLIISTSIILTSVMFIMNYFKFVPINTEVLIAPVIVSVLLGKGDKLLLFVFINPLNRILHLFSRTKSISK